MLVPGHVAVALGVLPALLAASLAVGVEALLVGAAVVLGVSQAGGDVTLGHMLERKEINVIVNAIGIHG